MPFESQATSLLQYTQYGPITNSGIRVCSAAVVYYRPILRLKNLLSEMTLLPAATMPNDLTFQIQKLMKIMLLKKIFHTIDFEALCHVLVRY